MDLECREVCLVNVLFCEYSWNVLCDMWRFGAEYYKLFFLNIEMHRIRSNMRTALKDPKRAPQGTLTALTSQYRVWERKEQLLLDGTLRRMLYDVDFRIYNLNETLLHLDWLRAGQLIVWIVHYLHCSEINVHAFKIFPYIKLMSKDSILREFAKIWNL